MRTSIGDLWSFHAQGAYIAITTNGMVKANGEAVLGAGLAKQAAARFPTLAGQLGVALRRHGNVPHLCADLRLITFPTKDDFRFPSTLSLIEQSGHRIVQLLDDHHISILYAPRHGCGLGQLSWASVEPLLSRIFDDRIVIVTPPRGTNTGGHDLRQEPVNSQRAKHSQKTHVSRTPSLCR
jgi:hypothetical protein